MHQDSRDVFGAPSVEAVRAYYEGMRAFWHPVLPVSDLPHGKPVGVTLLGEEVVLARLDDRIVALQDLCRHFQAQLSLGEIVTRGGKECLLCLYHGWAYDESGQCVDIPQLQPGREIPGQAKVPSYLVQEKHELIWVCLADEPAFGIPDFPEMADSTFHAGPLRQYEPWAASTPRIIMGALDDTHFPWVHPGILAERSWTEPPQHQVWRDGRYLMSQYTVAQPRNYSTADVSAEGDRSDAEQITYTNFVGVPNSIRLVKDGRAGRYVIWLATLSHTYNSTTTFWRVARNYDLNPGNDQNYEDFEDVVRAQDKPIVESQRPWLLPPFWTRIELPLRPADLPLIEYQRWLEELDISTSV